MDEAPQQISVKLKSGLVKNNGDYTTCAVVQCFVSLANQTQRVAHNSVSLKRDFHY